MRKLLKDAYHSGRVDGICLGTGGYTYTDTNDTMMIPMPVKICWNLLSNFMFIIEVKKKNKLAHAAHLIYTKDIINALLLVTFIMKA